MADDPSAAGDPEAGRSDLFARIQDLQDDVDSGLSAAQLQEAVRGAVAAALPALVSDAVSSAVAGALPAVAHAVAAEVTEQQTAPDTDGVEARLATLEDALDGVSDRLEALTRDQTATTAASFDELREQVAALGDPARGGATHDGREEIDALREDLADALDYVRTTLAAEVTARAAETQSAVRALSGSLDAVRPQDAQLILERLEALPYELPPPDLSPVHDQLAALAAAEPAVDLELLLGRLDAIEQAVSGTDLGPVHRRLDELAASLTARPADGEDLEALHVRFDSLLAAVDSAAEAARDRQAAETERLRAAVVETVELLPQTVDARVARLATGFSEQILDVRTDLATTAGETLSVLAGIRDRPQVDLSDRLDALTADVARLADAPPPVDHGDRLDALSGGLAGVDDRVDGVHGRLADLDDRIEALRSDLVDAADRGQTTLADRLAAAHDEVRARMVEDAKARRVDLDAVRESQEATSARLEQIVDHPLLSGAVDVGRELADLRALMAEVTGAAHEAASAARQEAGRADAAAAGRGQEVRDQVEALQAQLGAAVDGLPPQIAAWRTETADDRARLAAGLSGLERAREEMAALVERMGDQGATAAATVGEASLAALDQLRSDSDVAAADLRRDGETARTALEEHARTARQGVIDDVRTAAAAALDDIRAAITAQEQATSAATSEMEQVAHRVQSAGRLVVAYLSERDAALEEVRDRDTVQLLEDVLSALSRKEREKAAGETRGILARRRESRQAERWRQHQQDNANPDAVVDDEALLELLDAPAPRPHPGPAAAAPEPAATEPAATEDPQAAAETEKPAAASPKPAPAKKAAAKKAPAKKAAAKKMAAKKAPAKKAPAKKAPAKKAPATRAPAPAADAPESHAG